MTHLRPDGVLPRELSLILKSAMRADGWARTLPGLWSRPYRYQDADLNVTLLTTGNDHQLCASVRHLDDDLIPQELLAVDVRPSQFEVPGPTDQSDFILPLTRRMPGNRMPDPAAFRRIVAELTDQAARLAGCPLGARPGSPGHRSIRHHRPRRNVSHHHRRRRPRPGRRASAPGASPVFARATTCPWPIPGGPAVASPSCSADGFPPARPWSWTPAPSPPTRTATSCPMPTSCSSTRRRRPRAPSLVGTGIRPGSTPDEVPIRLDPAGLPAAASRVYFVVSASTDDSGAAPVAFPPDNPRLDPNRRRAHRHRARRTRPETDRRGRDRRRLRRGLPAQRRMEVPRRRRGLPHRPGGGRPRLRCPGVTTAAARQTSAPTEAACHNCYCSSLQTR